jgi:hypothetical protein
MNDAEPILTTKLYIPPVRPNSKDLNDVRKSRTREI